MGIKPHFNEKYSLEFRKKVIETFKNNTAKETAQKLGITENQVESIMETSRRKGLVSPRFKDKRNKHPWTFQEKLSLIRMAGILNRNEIGKRLNRDGQRNIKERMRNDFKSGTKFLHGMPLTWVKELIPMELADRLIQTKAGPSGQNNQFCFKIVPWVDMETVTYAIKLDPTLVSLIRSMAKFQRFIYQEDADWRVLCKIKKLL